MGGFPALVGEIARSIITRDNSTVLIYTRLMIIASAAFSFWYFGYPTLLAEDGVRSI